MEDLSKELEVFSAILLQQYIRLMLAAVYHRSDGATTAACFKISPENYAKMLAEPDQNSLIGLNLNYDEAANLLTVTAKTGFFTDFSNPIMREVALKYYDNYMNRYKSYIVLAE